MDFFMAEVLPELSSSSQASLILKADAIKFVSTFRTQLPVEVMDQLFPLLMNCMDPSQFVVHTYAAACLERLLTVKEESGALRFSKQRLAPYLGKLLEHVFNILEQPNYPENDYLMKVIMRVMNVAKEDILPLTDIAVNKLTNILNRICANPSNPSFSHYLFESISVLILNVCKASPDATERFEALLFPPFQKVLANDVEALSPYVYQVLAQMLELRPSGVSPAYMSMFPVLLTPTLWDRVSNVPAIVKLIEVYCRHDVCILHFMTLVSHRVTCHVPHSTGLHAESASRGGSIDYWHPGRVPEADLVANDGSVWLLAASRYLRVHGAGGVRQLPERDCEDSHDPPANAHVGPQLGRVHERPGLHDLRLGGQGRPRRLRWLARGAPTRVRNDRRHGYVIGFE